MEILKAYKKDGKVYAKVQTDEPERYDFDIETGERLKESEERLIVSVEVQDFNDEDLAKANIYDKVTYLIGKTDFAPILENTLLNEEEINLSKGSMKPIKVMF